MNENAKKAAVIFVCLFCFIPQAFIQAAHFVPTPQQLQPPPAGIAPNLSGNVNHESVSQKAASDSATTTENGNPAAAAVKGKAAVAADDDSGRESSARVWWLTIIAVIVLGGAGTWFLRSGLDEK